MKPRDAALATLTDISVQTGGNSVLSHINLTVHQGEQWAIVGHSGSGKTTLAHVFTGSVFHSGEMQYHFPAGTNAHIELVAQQHHFKNLSNTSSFYYQQRFNASEAADSITVADVLAGHRRLGGDEGWLGRRVWHVFSWVKWAGEEGREAERGVRSMEKAKKRGLAGRTECGWRMSWCRRRAFRWPSIGWKAWCGGATDFGPRG